MYIYIDIYTCMHLSARTNVDQGTNWDGSEFMQEGYVGLVGRQCVKANKYIVRTGDSEGK